MSSTIEDSKEGLEGEKSISGTKASPQQGGDTYTSGGVLEIVEEAESLPVLNIPEGAGDAGIEPKHHQALKKLKESFDYQNFSLRAYEKLKAKGLTEVSDLYNSFVIMETEVGEDLKTALENNTAYKEDILPLTKGQDALIFLRESPEDHSINSKIPAFFILESFRSSLRMHFIKYVAEQIGDEELKADLELSGLCTELNELAYADNVSNDLGQAQTAHRAEALAAFRNFEKEGDRNLTTFGYVYLDEAQFRKLNCPEDSEFHQLQNNGNRYYALPIGRYFELKDPTKYQAMIAKLKGLEEKNKEKKPAASAYYKALREYYEFRGKDKNSYFQACYKAEKDWVKYAKETQDDQSAKYIHVHPFENYETASTKNHALQLAIIERETTEKYAEAARKLTANARAFFYRHLEADYAAHCARTLELLESTVNLSFRARVGGNALLAQCVPNESEGRKAGMVSLYDTDYSHQVYRELYAGSFKARDPIGVLAERYAKAMGNRDQYLAFAIFSTLAHEMGHNFFKLENSGAADEPGEGIATSMIDEAVASAHLVFNFADPYNLTEEETGKLQELMFQLVPSCFGLWSARNREQHQSNQYLREGAVFLDFFLESGVLEIVGVELKEMREKTEVKLGEPDLKKDFHYIKIKNSPEAVKKFIALVADFLKNEIAPRYAKAYGNREESANQIQRYKSPAWAILEALGRERLQKEEISAQSQCR